MSEKKPFIVGNWDDLFLANKIRTLERKKKTNLYLATIGFLCFALFGGMFGHGAPAGTPQAIEQGQRAIWIAITFSIVLLVSTGVAAFLSRKAERVAILESALIKGFRTALDASDLNPAKKDNKKGEVRT